MDKPVITKFASQDSWSFIYWLTQFWRLCGICRCYIVNWRINKLLLQRNLYSGAKHIPLSSKRPLSCWRLFHSDQTNTIIVWAPLHFYSFCESLSKIFTSLLILAIWAKFSLLGQTSLFALIVFRASPTVSPSWHICGEFW